MTPTPPPPPPPSPFFQEVVKILLVASPLVQLQNCEHQTYSLMSFHSFRNPAFVDSTSEETRLLFLPFRVVDDS